LALAGVGMRAVGGLGGIRQARRWWRRVARAG